MECTLCSSSLASWCACTSPLLPKPCASTIVQLHGLPSSDSSGLNPPSLVAATARRRVGGVLSSASRGNLSSGLTPHAKDYLAIRIAAQLGMDVDESSAQPARDAVISDCISLWFSKYFFPGSTSAFPLSNLFPVRQRASLDCKLLQRLSEGGIQVCSAHMPRVPPDTLCFITFMLPSRRCRLRIIARLLL